ncbi:MAG: FmdE, Molybdenum formylmethanofuran dehydrogenase operon [Candidatus Methanofastidiosum methylothiophilum]|uniref:FmdE, Molybdenum formylmethanofuran dehydrogenase operon n=1 Tax=Candidatus Methanofastidiosum methylothiophilum TaxID=1705564 RepID=A0A150IN35_9EURY|nr:MAG: FmdE, Molybdenum formylmethanofuran dehydrogenase operon [Candidatus Methanofastidiosum methylthiophilus]KYC48312.1 MAG: FmdE, Molybdenum formylmethanofuran dehydrogenase operon [Candidatus Methanofastidiosum methylthiophilus]KYC50981.1 MAG: FmdE, Molybdenum formylmethanofuran dehydrogenase operon [Candidatus Methanofastidiosum methylthiophilus]
MKVTTMDFDNMSSKELSKRLSEFHGHLGPYLVLGAKMGLYAKKTLSSSPFEISAEITMPLKPPLSCTIDGIQFTSGATTGKANLKVSDGLPIKIVFYKENDGIVIVPKQNILEIIRTRVGHEDLEMLAEQIMEKDYTELFEVQKWTKQ